MEKVIEYRVEIEDARTGQHIRFDWDDDAVSIKAQYHQQIGRESVRNAYVERREVTYSAPVVVGIEEVR